MALKDSELGRVRKAQEGDLKTESNPNTLLFSPSFEIKF